LIIYLHSFLGTAPIFQYASSYAALDVGTKIKIRSPDKLWSFNRSSLDVLRYA